MLVIAAQLFGGQAVDGLEGVHEGLSVTAGDGAALAFALALLPQGLAASAVGTFSGQVVMAGFLRRRVPLLARRAITVAPALAVLFVGLDQPGAQLVTSDSVVRHSVRLGAARLAHRQSVGHGRLGDQAEARRSS